MKQFVFSTNNQHKLEEVRAKLGNDYRVIGLQDLGDNTEVPETGTTLEENARIKAQYLWNTYHQDCFADDTGLEVEALNNAPGVYSARYAGEQKSAEDNVAKLLTELASKNNRKARFRTVIALIVGGELHLFEGVVDGSITSLPQGTAGFGYDPIFCPNGYDKTFAELTLEDKNNISHRAKAVEQLVAFLKK